MTTIREQVQAFMEEASKDVEVHRYLTEQAEKAGIDFTPERTAFAKQSVVLQEVLRHVAMLKADMDISDHLGMVAKEVPPELKDRLRVDLAMRFLHTLLKDDMMLLMVGILTSAGLQYEDTKNLSAEDVTKTMRGWVGH